MKSNLPLRFGIAYVALWVFVFVSCVVWPTISKPNLDHSFIFMNMFFFDLPWLFFAPIPMLGTIINLIIVVLIGWAIQIARDKIDAN
jgi:hypothetical protein